MENELTPDSTLCTLEICVDDDSKLTLHGRQQYYVKLAENQKNRKLNDPLDALEFNQGLRMLSSEHVRVLTIACTVLLAVLSVSFVNG
jgi:hypothetical protein